MVPIRRILAELESSGSPCVRPYRISVRTSSYLAYCFLRTTSDFHIVHEIGLRFCLTTAFLPAHLDLVWIVSGGYHKKKIFRTLIGESHRCRDTDRAAGGHYKCRLEFSAFGAAMEFVESASGGAATPPFRRKPTLHSRVVQLSHSTPQA